MKINSLFLPVIGMAGALLMPIVAQAAPMHHTESVYQRLHNERMRIRHGARSHELSHREAVRLNHRVARIQRKAAYDRYRHGGRLSYAQRMRLDHRLNKTSKKIYSHKH